MQIEVVIVGELECNCYILSLGNHAIVIDPGDEYGLIKVTLQDKIVDAVLVTHHHHDHDGALYELVDDYKVSVYDYYNLKEGIKEIGDWKLEVIRTPGHTSDSVTYYFEQEKVMFGGDFIFRHNIGRCDLPTGDFKVMLESIKKIKKYPLDTIVYPGHGEATTLREEVMNNPYFNY